MENFRPSGQQCIDILLVEKMRARRKFLNPEEINQIRKASSRNAAQEIGNQIFFSHQERAPREEYEEYTDGVRAEIDHLLGEACTFSEN